MKTESKMFKVTAASGSAGKVIALCKRHKLTVASIAVSEADPETTLVAITTTDALLNVNGFFFLPKELVQEINRIMFSTKAFIYTTGFSPRKAKVLVMAITELPKAGTKTK